ncbi:hypothetical protein AB0D10_00770 [Kitasatospora sp. NPDC048545]|uniref:hypothetical protein n=1 Tax=Kitasatospora sp. NPDC048545 TaxID=3157208 RepID=UPI0033CD7119
MDSRSNRRHLQTYTGDSAWYLARTGSTHPEVGIPAASDDQALIEHLFLNGLKGGSAYAAHPVSIRATRVLDGRTAVLLDQSAFVAGRLHPIAERAIELLPFEAEDGSLGGVDGLRTDRPNPVDRRGLHLRLLQAPTARLTLVGPAQNEWTNRLAAREQELTAARCQPLWTTRERGAAELAHRAAHGSYEDEEAESRWLTSGLLRRIGLWHNTSNAFCTRYWQRGDGTFIWELRHLYGVPVTHDDFAAHLKDPQWGLPLSVQKSHCDCHSRRPDRGGQPHPDYQRQCTFTFHHRGDRAGELQIRFRTEAPTEDRSDTREELRRVGADSAWLRRVLPLRGPQG